MANRRAFYNKLCGTEPMDSKVIEAHLGYSEWVCPGEAVWVRPFSATSPCCPTVLPHVEYLFQGRQTVVLGDILFPYL